MRSCAHLRLALLILACMGALGEEAIGPPDAAAIYEEAKTSEMRVLYATGFEEAEPPHMVQNYARGAQKLDFLGVTDEEAHSGKRSYKMQVSFEPGPVPAAYFLLPFEVPRWSEIRMRFHVKTMASQELHPRHGYPQVYGGKVAEEENGWEIWEVTASRTSNLDDQVSGVQINYYQISQKAPATTVTVYVDDVEVTGKLPSNWKEKWEEVHTHYTVHHNTVIRQAATRRLAGMKARLALLKRAYQPAKLPEDTSALLRGQYDACCRRIEEDLSRVAPMMEAIEKALANEAVRFNADLNAPERILSHLRLYVDIAQAYAPYARHQGQADVVTFVLEPTQSYAILPGGPTGHKDELSHYNWSGRGFENPQVLPDAVPVPAAPSQQMTGFGCRGTYVPLSFAILPQDTLEGLTFEVSDLRSEAGDMPAGAIDIRTVATWWRPWNSDGNIGPRLMNELLLHDADFAAPAEDKKENVYRDSKFGRDSDTLQPVTIPGGTARQFYVLARIPEDASAGVYRGEITGAVRGEEVVRVQMEVEVLPFDLEPTPYAYSFY